MDGHRGTGGGGGYVGTALDSGRAAIATAKRYVRWQIGNHVPPPGGGETLYDALLTAREVREEWERYDTLSTDSHPPIHTVYDTIANKDTVYVWVHMRHQ